MSMRLFSPVCDPGISTPTVVTYECLFSDETCTQQRSDAEVVERYLTWLDAQFPEDEFDGLLRWERTSFEEALATGRPLEFSAL